MSTDSAIENASPKSIMNAGTGRKNRHSTMMMPTAKPISLPSKGVATAGAGVDVNDTGRSPRECPRTFAREACAGLASRSKPARPAVDAGRAAARAYSR